MGGPSVESHRAAEAARKKRLASMRTRDGVVDLAEWRTARRAAEFLESAHGSLSLVLGIRLRAARTVGFEVEVTLVQDDPAVRLCFPSVANDIPVRFVVRNPRRSRPACPSVP